MQSRLDKSISLLISWSITLSCFSYPITIVMIINIGIPSNITNIILKAVYSALYSLLITLTLFKHKATIRKEVKPLLYFFFFYSLRLIYDIGWLNIPMLGYSSSYVYSYYFGATLLPCLAIILSSSLINVKQILKFTAIFLIFANIAHTYQVLVKQGLTEVLANRAQFTNDSDLEFSGFLINPIIVGYFGALLSLFSIASIITQNSMKFSYKILFSVLFVYGFGNIILGASRGPLFTFAILLIFILAYYIKHNSSIAKSILSLSVVFMISAVLISIYVVPYFENNTIFLFDRLETFSDNLNTGEKEYRNYAYAAAINDFLESPIYGYQYVGTFDSFYPHNIIIEVLMSVGVIGGFCFLGAFRNFLRGILFIWRKSSEQAKLPLILVCITSTMLSLTSGSIMASPDFWVLFTFLILLARPSNPHHQYI